MRSRQAEQPYRRNPDGEAATGERSGGEANQSGMVRFCDVKKGFGFVTRPGRDDLSVHASALGTLSPLELTEGRPVTA